MSKIKFYLAGIFCLGLMFGISHFVSANSTISGTVLKANGDPVVDEDLYLFNTSNTFNGETDDDGHFTIIVNTAPISGNYILQAPTSDYQYSLSHISYERFYSQTREITVVDGVNQTGTDFTLNQHGVVQGTISDNDSLPVYDAEMYVWNKNDIQEYNYDVYFYGYDSTGTNGFYYVTPLMEGVYGNHYDIPAAGEYQAYITAKGYLPKYIDNLVISDNQELTQNITLTKKSYLSGYLTSKDGAGLSNVSVQVFKKGEITPYYVTQTDSLGYYQIEFGKDGEYDDFGDFTAQGTYDLRISYDTTSLYNPKNKTITISSDESNLTKNYKLTKRKGGLKGKIKSKNKALSDATLKLHLQSDPNFYCTIYTDSNGKFNFHHLKTGTYQLSVSKDKYATLNTNLKISKKAKKNFKLSAAGYISGYIFDNKTKKPLDVIIQIANTDLITSANDNGYYYFNNVPVGKHKLFIKSPYYFEDQFYNRAKSYDKATTVTVKKGKTTKNVNFYLNRYAYNF